MVRAAANSRQCETDWRREGKSSETSVDSEFDRFSRTCTNSEPPERCRKREAEVDDKPHRSDPEDRFVSGLLRQV